MAAAGPDGVTVEGYHPKGTDTPEAYMNSIGPCYFMTLNVPILAGRDWDKPDDLAPRVVIVNEKFAKRFFGSARNAIGHHAGLGIDPGTKMDMEIVGVIKDIKFTNLAMKSPFQMFEPYLADNFVSNMTVYVRTTMDPEQFFSVVRTKIHAMDGNLPLYAMRSMDDQISNSLLVERLIANLSAVFGFLATLRR